MVSALRAAPFDFCSTMYVPLTVVKSLSVPTAPSVSGGTNMLLSACARKLCTGAGEGVFAWLADDSSDVPNGEGSVSFRTFGSGISCGSGIVTGLAGRPSNDCRRASRLKLTTAAPTTLALWLG